MRVLVAPDKFKHALTADQAAAAIAEGIRGAHPAWTLTFLPLADGGDGSGAILARSFDARCVTEHVLDPLARTRRATWWKSPSGDAIIELAEASGLALLGPLRDPLRASSFGTGQLISAAIRAGCRRILLCVGGSATVDGGAGALQALGWRYFDAAGSRIDEPVGGGHLRDIARITLPVASYDSRPEIAILCDVENPMVGPRGAATVFGPQKGATPVQVRQLELGLRHWCSLLAAATGVDPADVPHAGAAGGLPGGLHAAMGAKLVSGFEEIAKHRHLRLRLAECELCVTGEGRIDDQSLRGKVVGGVARLAREAGVSVVAFAGAASPPDAEGVRNLAARLDLLEIILITPPGVAEDEALRDAAANLRAAASRFARSMSA